MIALQSLGSGTCDAGPDGGWFGWVGDQRSVAQTAEPLTHCPGCASQHRLGPEEFMHLCSTVAADVM
jgi:hypothetical protein